MSADLSMWTQPRRIVQPRDRPLTSRHRAFWVAPGALWEFRTRKEALRWMRASKRATRLRRQALGWNV